MGVLVHIESVSPATATSMIGTTRRFGSGSVHRKPLSALKAGMSPIWLSLGVSRARISSK